MSSGSQKTCLHETTCRDMSATCRLVLVISTFCRGARPRRYHHHHDQLARSWYIVDSALPTPHQYISAECLSSQLVSVVYCPCRLRAVDVVSFVQAFMSSVHRCISRFGIGRQINSQTPTPRHVVRGGPTGWGERRGERRRGGRPHVTVLSLRAQPSVTTPKARRRHATSAGMSPTTTVSAQISVTCHVLPTCRRHVGDIANIGPRWTRGAAET